MTIPTTPTPAPSGGTTPSRAPARKRTAFQRLGVGLMTHLWPAVAVFLVTALALWDRADPKVVWIVAAVAAVVFLILLRVLWRRAKGVAHSMGETVKGLAIALVLVAALVALVWFVFLKG